MSGVERNLYLGVDPGGSGGIAILDMDGAVVDVTPMPDGEHAIADYFNEFSPRIKMAIIEIVHSFPGQGVASSFKFGRGYGGLIMALVCTKIPFEYVAPGVWQKPFGLIETGRKSHDSKTEKKNKHKERAASLFPSVKITHAIADAVLLAEFCRRKAKGLL